jgi:hypothetical protein
MPVRSLAYKTNARTKRKDLNMLQNSLVNHTILPSSQMTAVGDVGDLFKKSASQTVNPDSTKLYSYAEKLAKARENEVSSQVTTHNVDKNKFIKAIAKKLFNRDWKPELVTVESLKRKESAIGGSLFYTGRPNERIEFFNDNMRSWFFYQELTDAKGINHSTTLHYEVNPLGVLKVSTKNSMKCEYIIGQEYDNFMQSTALYYERVMKHLYKQDVVLDKTSK